MKDNHLDKHDKHERARHLMMAALDDEQSAEERAELDGLLASDAALNDEWRRLSKVKEVTATMAFREPPEEVWENYWVSVYNRAERGLGWILFCVSSVVLIGYGVWKAVWALLADSSLPWFIKLAILGAALGGAILAFSVCREKFFVRRKDPYKEIQR